MIIQFLKDYVCTNKNAHILILFSLIFSSFAPTLSPIAQAKISHEAITFTQKQPCGGIIPQPSNTNKRLLVLLMGLGSYTTPADADNGLSGLNKAQNYWTNLIDTRVDDQTSIGSLYDDILYFSYSTEDSEYYTKDDSSRSISTHHVQLLYDTLQECYQAGWETFDIVGHSLGGVTASEYIKKYGLTSSQKGWVKHVITLDSPVNGSLLIWCANYYWKDIRCLHLKGFASLLLARFAPKFQETEAAYELATMYERRDELNDSNIRIVKALEGLGTFYRNLTNANDQLVITRRTAFWVNTEGPLWPVANNDGIVEGFGRDFDLGFFDVRESPPSGGHAFIVSKAHEYPEVLQYIRHIICDGPEGTNNPACSNVVAEPIPIPNQHVNPNNDNAKFTGIESPAPDTPVTPGQTIHKTWRVKNTGGRLWGSGDKLVFTGGEQMGAPNEVAIPVTAPGETIDIGVDIVAPNTPGAQRGNWQLRNSQGTFFGDKLWVQITVPGANNASSSEIACTNCPTTVAPGQTFRPTVRVKISSGQLLATRGDMLRNTDGNLYGAFEHVAVVGTANPGQPYDFIFYSDHPITAPQNDGIYESKWRVWQGGSWVGPELTIRFEVKAGAGQNHAPNAPTLTGPGDWAVYTGNGGIGLTAQQNGDPDNDSVNQYYFEIFESAQNATSGWISSNSWSPQGLGFNGYQWRAKARDSRGAESGWSPQVWHFTIQTNEPQISSFTSVQCHEPWGNTEQICFCATTNAGTLQLQINSATDGSDRGAWKIFNELGTANYNCQNDNDRPPNLTQLEYETGTHLVRLYARRDGGWAAAANRDLTINLPTERRPNSPSGLLPVYQSYLNSRIVTFDWADTLRTQNYRLLVATDPGFTNVLFDQTFAQGTTQHTATLAGEYEKVYWRVYAAGPYGTNDSSQEFSIDETAPTSAISALPPVTTDTKFSVSWGGADARSGLRWYQVQVRDGNRVDSQWTDWLVNTTKTGEIFPAQTGHTYYFRVRAMDAIGNWEGWPPGDGDTFTLVNPAAAPSTAWWNNSYTSKRNLIIRNNDSDTIPAQYPIHIQFNDATNPTATELYNASTSAVKGDDLRVVYNNATELNRVIRYFTLHQIDIWFPLQTALGSGQTDNGGHQIYFGYAGANTPPANPESVFAPRVDGNTMGLWRFQEGSGSTVYDVSGRAHHGNFINPGWGDSIFGGVGTFNGSNSYVEIGHSDDFKPGAITLEAWIYLTGATGEYPMIFNKDRYWFRITGDKELQFMIKADGGDRTLTGQTHINLAQWYHVAATYDGGQRMRVYINGRLDREQNNGAPPVLWNSQPLRIGRSDYNTSSYFPGHIQHARVSNIERTDFSYAQIDVAATVEIGALVAPPTPGTPDLVVLGLNSYPNADGTIIVEAVVQNQGNRDTQNGFYNDLYVDHLPTGAGDYTGSIQLWVNSPIAAGAVVTLTASLPTLTGEVVAAQSAAPGSEATHTLYLQTDSAGVVPESNKANNVSAVGTEICLATADAFEGNNTVNTSSILVLNQAQSHNFDHAGDQDWVKFNAEAGKTYYLSTSNLGAAADTALYLYSTDGTTLLTTNDDVDDSLASRIGWVAPANGTYYLLIRHWNPNVSGCGTSYQLLWEVIDTSAPTPTPTATPLPPDVTPPTATPTATPTSTSVPGETATSTPTDAAIPVATATPDLSVPGSKIYLPLVSAKPNSTPTPILAPNLAPNPSFEAGSGDPTGWISERRNGTMAFEWDSTAAHSGNRALAIKNFTPGPCTDSPSPSCADGQWMTSQLITIDPTHDYELSAWYRNTTGTDRVAFLAIMWANNDSYALGSTGLWRMAPTNDWAYRTVVISAADLQKYFPGVQRVQLSFSHFIEQNDGGGIWLDDIVFRDVTK